MHVRKPNLTSVRFLIYRDKVGILVLEDEIAAVVLLGFRQIAGINMHNSDAIPTVGTQLSYQIFHSLLQTFCVFLLQFSRAKYLKTHLYLQLDNQFKHNLKIVIDWLDVN